VTTGAGDRRWSGWYEGAGVNQSTQEAYVVDGGEKNEATSLRTQEILAAEQFRRRYQASPCVDKTAIPSVADSVADCEGSPPPWSCRTRLVAKWLPMPQAEASRTAHHVLMNLSSAIAEADYAAFCWP